MRAWRAVSLLETTMALFLLLVSVLLVVQLFHRALRYYQGSQREVLATRLAEKVQDEVRLWALDPDNFVSNWAAWRGVTRSDPDYPGMVATVDCSPPGRTVYSPCSSIESMFAPDERTLDRSVMAVRVRVPWAPGRSVTLLTYCSEPARAPAGDIEVVRGANPPDPIPQDGQVTLTARALDDRGRAIEDLTFRWYVSPISLNPVPPGPGPGNAIVTNEGSRDGRTCVVQHRYRYDPVTGAWSHKAGTIVVRCRAVYRGKELWGESNPILLQ
ncbi:MAG: hypothetical protein AB1758_31555 [Candidatus Eremiobacterota bacterium]